MISRMDPQRHHRTFTLLRVCSVALALGLVGCGAPAAQPCPPESAPTAPPASTPGPSDEAGSTAATPTPEATASPVAGPGAPAELSYTKPLAGVSSMDQALGKVKSALAEQGFGVITEIDVQMVMKKKLGVEMKPFWILGACNPKKAHQAIEADPEMGLLLPCKVIVYQDAADAFVVAFARPKTIFGLMGQPGLSSLADQVEAEMRAAFDAL